MSAGILKHLAQSKRKPTGPVGGEKEKKYIYIHYNFWKFWKMVKFPHFLVFFYLRLLSYML